MENVKSLFVLGELSKKNKTRILFVFLSTLNLVVAERVVGQIDFRGTSTGFPSSEREFYCDEPLLSKTPGPVSSQELYCGIHYRHTDGSHSIEESWFTERVRKTSLTLHPTSHNNSCPFEQQMTDLPFDSDSGT